MAARQSLWEKLVLIARAGAAASGRALTMGALSTALGLVVSLGAGCGVTINPAESFDGGADGSALVDEDGDGYDVEDDCDDTDPDVNPGQPAESCCPPADAVDQNCDGLIGPSEVDIACNCFYDEDGDGWGDGFGPGPDCDDTDASIHPEAEEICGDGIDQNCDGSDLVCEEPGS